MKSAVILGLTGSIGSNGLRGIQAFKDKIKISGASVNTRIDEGLKLCEQYGIENLCITSNTKLKDKAINQENVKLFCDLEQMLVETKPDIVLNGIAGTAGLKASLTVAKQGITLALANKETIVLGGKLFLNYAKEHKCRIIPVDSEHSALDQLIQNCSRENITKLLITASGGPFLNTPLEELKNISPKMAANHPTWKMGSKISIESSNLANKGLEVIEAHFLFDFPPESIEVLIHPQSIVHSMVKTKNGQIYAQLSEPDMALPIMRALLEDEVDKSFTKQLDFDFLNLNFQKVDTKRFPLLKTDFDCLKKGGLYPLVYCKANELAVESFLQEKLAYNQIYTATEKLLQTDWSKEPSCFEEIFETEEKATNLFSKLNF